MPATFHTCGHKLCIKKFENTSTTFRKRNPTNEINTRRIESEKNNKTLNTNKVYKLKNSGKAYTNDKIYCLPFCGNKQLRSD